MRPSHVPETSDARAMVDAARQAAASHADGQGPARVSIAVVDGGGHLLLFERLDGASPASSETAIAKARSTPPTATPPAAPGGEGDWETF